VAAQTAVNRWVVGSNPTTGASLNSEDGEIRLETSGFLLFCLEEFESALNLTYLIISIIASL
tara:strand:+ start:197 stop:382 length:186 start_codon:yes stop_codon:yes gene_type:complete